MVDCAGRLPGVPEVVSWVPFSWRLGSGYGDFLRRAAWFDTLPVAEKKAWIFDKMKRLVQHAEAHVPFYQAHYLKARFSSRELSGYDDLSKIPIVTKADMQQATMEARTAPGGRVITANTGGTSGQPLAFQLERSLMAKETAYIHHLWRRRGYAEGRLKLRFRGAILSEQAFRYHAVENEFLVNTYASYDRIGGQVERLFLNHRIGYLHGYPSAIYAFACHCRDHFSARTRDRIRQNLRGVLLGSEYPAPQYRQVIDEVFGPVSLSWYGHSEMAVLAGERDRAGEYEPFQSYGHIEAVTGGSSDSQRLVGTNLDGFACPFIRYDTGDLVKIVAQDEGLLLKFAVAEGRVGDFVLDANGHPVSLTALIFGRHHGVFAQLAHLQVAQEKPGEVLLIASMPKDTAMAAEQFWQGFDATGVDIRFNVRFVPTPYRTPAGKVPLKVPFTNV
jgi:phenylacetate-CoA ligase